jgi:glyoxylase-like metal-dependent hydrolase (beta-lactamase superfamily II)/tetratricopeptide (TPR) repeat protein
MKNAKVLCCLAVLLTAGAYPQTPEAGFWGRLAAGPFAPGFRLIEASDACRSFPANGVTGLVPRPIRIYVWYPAKPSAAERLRLDDYVQMALEDFRPASLPVPLTKGIEPGNLKALLDSRTGAVRDAPAGPGKFPLLILGQGLYYESPLSHFVLCEFLASRGYVVATSPLVGTRYRLVNINVEDVETEVRDMEFVLATVRTLPFVDPEKLGVVGYDLGGMAGLIMSMRNPDVGGFLSLDSAILDTHFSGLPGSHPQYREERFLIPWMHMTQARFIRTEKDRVAPPSLFERKTYGPSYLVHVPTSNHGDFSSYAAMGITRAVPGYWGAAESDPQPFYEEICRAALAFFDDCLKEDGGSLEQLLQAGQGAGPGKPSFKIEHKKGLTAPPSEAELVHLIIEKGLAEAGPAIDKIRSDHPGLKPIDESVLNWLGLHFFLWWGREEEAVGVFELNASLYPGSWKAYDTLGWACAERGRTDEAIRSYKKSLELNPQNSTARTALEKLSEPAKRFPEILDAVKAGDLAKVKALVEKDPKIVNERLPNGTTVLFAAVANRRLEITEYLISKGAEVNIQNNFHSTPLDLACANGAPLELVKLLVEKGADVNAVAKYSGKPMDLALDGGDAAVIDYLKSKGAQPTPLEFETSRLAKRVQRIAYPWGMRNNVIVFSGPDGILLVDTGFSKHAVGALRETIGRLAKGEIKYVLNTHAHGDHVAGNGILPPDGKAINFQGLERQDFQGLISKGARTLRGRSGRELAAPYLMRLNGEEVQIIPNPGLHSEADLLIYFPMSKVLCMGDLLLSECCPAVQDVAGYMDFLDKVIDIFPAGTMFVSGHGKDLTRDGLRKYRDDLAGMIEIVRKNYAAGKSAEDMVSDDVLKAYKGEYSLLDWIGPDSWLLRIVEGWRSGSLK